jgi:hypothetical protein
LPGFSATVKSVEVLLGILPRQYSGLMGGRQRQ